MNLFKELALGQKEKKRMGKWIRQRFLNSRKAYLGVEEGLS
jgi:hypothetical protein